MLAVGLIVLMLGRNALPLAGHLATGIVVAVVLFEGATAPARNSPFFVLWFLAAISAGIAIAFLDYPGLVNHGAVGARGEGIFSSTRFRFILFPSIAALIAIETARLPSTSWWIIVVLLFVLAVFAYIVLRRLKDAHIVHAITIFIIVIASIALGAALEKYDSSQEIALSFANAIVGLLFLSFVSVYLRIGIEQCWLSLVRAERKQRHETNRENVRREIGGTAGRVWTVSIGLGIGVFLAIIPLATLAIDSSTITLSGKNHIVGILPLVGLAWVTVLVLVTSPEQKLMFARSSLQDDMPDERKPVRTWNRWAMVLLLGIGTTITTVMAIQVEWQGLVSFVVIGIIVVIG